MNKTYFAGEYDWLGFDGGSTPTGDPIVPWFHILEQTAVGGGDAFWSLFGHDVPNCHVSSCPSSFSFSAELTSGPPPKIFVNHSDGFTMQYGNPANSEYVDDRIKLVRQHLMDMAHGVYISENSTLPAVPCPAPARPCSS